MNIDLEFSFDQQIEPFYRQLVELLLHDIDSLDDVEKQVRLEESCIAIEDMQKEELENLFFITGLDDQRQSINEIDPQAAAIYSIVLDNSLEVILDVREQPLQYYRSEIDKNSQEKIFQKISQYLDPAFPYSEVLPYVQKLYNWLILPVEDMLQEQEITTLVFILDGFLRGVPMAALHDGQQYLIEKYNIALIPGLQLPLFEASKSSEYSLLIGSVTQARQGFSNLPSVEREVEQVSQITTSKILLNEEFTGSSLAEQLDNLENSSPLILHFATYAQFSSQVEDAFVLDWSDRLSINYFSKLREKNKTKGAIELLVLTSGTTVAEDSNAILGLTAMAICSGAKSTVATIWLTRDRSTVSLITEFYRLLTQENISKSEALRKAQISLLQDSQYQHPYYWSSFVLFGDWK
ncbi:hypothetical protein Xen7305DRAFT_00035100 [Xenococcus sp. PCC 7305]|uniref:CHAT domain-containing protein n=1 Tax=Xenococcus sp. PCC 7305 TaxID=102125 RepID=UPI0002AB9F72|nr:CHAT domain-containing protein [Xenococcus sp. PCC 7305]ELS03786.1 hypothetical protein Xen7305DRAFT_00035100 [Xenococcus sp. PCC 7305]